MRLNVWTRIQAIFQDRVVGVRQHHDRVTRAIAAVPTTATTTNAAAAAAAVGPAHTSRIHFCKRDQTREQKLTSGKPLKVT